MSFTSNDKELCASFEGWTCNSYPDMAPRSFYDCFEPDFVSWVKDNAEDQAAMALAATAFPAEVRDELEQPSELSFDTVEGSEDIAREAIQQDLELDEAEVHNLPASEQERREGRKQLPQRIRGALRRLHRQFGHCPHKVLINLLRAAKVDKAYVDDAKLLRCAECEEAAPRRPAHKVAMPEKYTFNHSLGIDILEVLDASGTKFQELNMICLGTCFQLCEVVREGPGQASSSVCLDDLGWAS